VHPDLVVTRKGIQEAKESATGRIIHRSVNTGNRVGILRTSLVEVCEVDAHPPLPANFLYQLHVRQPLRVLDLPDMASLEQLLCLFSDDLTPFFFSGEQVGPGVHSETMTQEVWIYVRHV